MRTVVLVTGAARGVGRAPAETGATVHVANPDVARHGGCTVPVGP